MAHMDNVFTVCMYIYIYILPGIVHTIQHVIVYFIMYVFAHYYLVHCIYIYTHTHTLTFMCLYVYIYVSMDLKSGSIHRHGSKQDPSNLEKKNAQKTVQVIEWLGVIGWLRRAEAPDDEKCLGFTACNDPWGKTIN